MVATSEYNISKIWEDLQNIMDPEIPVISIVEIGMVRKVENVNGMWQITITPTYTACPAVHFIKNQIAKMMEDHQWTPYHIVTQMAPAWTTDWLNEATKEKMRTYGIAPPPPTSCGGLFGESTSSVLCPKCKSANTQVISIFGSTACKSLFKCLDCKEPFEHFKCH